MLKRTVLAKSLLIAFSGSAAMYAAPSFAQDAAAPDSTPTQQLQRVEITGSAIRRIDAETAVPITVIKIDDLKKQGVTTIEQVMASVSSMQMQQGTSQVVGLGTGGASFADLRGLGANKTLVLLNGRRLANNAYDSSAPDLNMIPFAALERVEVLRDGASALYGSDAVGGVINFITRRDFTGGTITVGMDSPQHPGGVAKSANIGLGFGDLGKDGFNVFGILDRQIQDRIGGTQRPYNTRYAGGISPTTNPANYFQAGATGNPTAPTCAAGTDLIPNAAGLGCQMTTSSFVDYIPRSERTSGLLKGTLKLGENHELGLEYFASQSVVQSQIAPVPYGALRQNPFLTDGVTPNPYYPGHAGNSFTPNIPLDPAFNNGGALPAGAQPGYITVKWRDLPNGPRADQNINNQQRLVASLSGNLGAWDYQAAATYNENKVKENLIGYSNGGVITAGVLNGIINPFGPQDAAGSALIDSAALNGNVENAKGTTAGVDAHASRELGDWLGAGRSAALAIGGEAQHQKFVQKANPVYAAQVVSSTGIDPGLDNEGSRNVYAAYAELNVPIVKDLDVTAALRYDKYSDFGSTTNPKVSFRYQPVQQLLLRGSYSTGFRAPSLYEINSAQAYTNSTIQNDPVNCPGGVVAPGKTEAISCQAQFETLTGGNKNLKPEKSKNAAFGLVLQPAADLTLGIDFWWVRLTQAIGTLNQDDVFGPNFATLYAGLYHRDPQGNLSTDGSQCPDPTTCGYVDLRTQNLGGINTNGIDLSANYRLRAGDIGSFAFLLNSTYVQKYEYQNSEGGEWHQNVGVYSGTGPVFRWQHNVNFNWTLREFGAGLAAHYKSAYGDDPSNAPDGFRVASYTTFDVYTSWAATKGFGITLGIRNMFDRAPPLSYQTQTFQAGYDPRFTDPTGRTYYLRGSYTF
jgi:iron complex outermembrane receptor protein